MDLKGDHHSNYESRVIFERKLICNMKTGYLIRKHDKTGLYRSVTWYTLSA